MRSFYFLFLLFAAFPVSAQSNSISVIEEETSKHYRFATKTSSNRTQDLVDAFCEISELDIHRKFRGDWQVTTQNGIDIYLNTRRGKLIIEYDGTDPDIIAEANAKAEVVREYFNKPPPPTPTAAPTKG